MSTFKHKPNRDINNNCIPKYNNYTAYNNKNAPALQIIKNKELANQVFCVKDAEGNDICLSPHWIAGFADGEGTFTFFLIQLLLVFIIKFSLLL